MMNLILGKPYQAKTYAMQRKFYDWRAVWQFDGIAGYRGCFLYDLGHPVKDYKKIILYAETHNIKIIKEGGTNGR